MRPSWFTARRFAEPVAQPVEVGVGKRGFCSSPRLDGQSLHGREDAVVDIFGGDSVSYVIVPYGEHASQNGGVLFLKHFFADVGRRPLVVEHLRVEVIVVVAGRRYDVYHSVGDADELVALFSHFLGLGVAVVPRTHDDVFRFHGCLAVGMGQCAPYAGLLAEAFHVADVMVGEGAELFYDVFLLVGVLVGTDVHLGTTEHGSITSRYSLKSPSMKV